MRVDLLTDVEDGGRTVHLLVRIAADVDEHTERPPVNLALVIDRSSSMRGPRLAQALAAARELVGRLEVRDRLSLITFDSHAEILCNPTQMTREARDVMLAALHDIRTGIGTNIGAGIRKGAEALRSGYVPGALSRVVLLTDGLPSIGITDQDRLSELVANELARGVVTTTMGLGLGFDDEMLSELARKGRGGFYYLAAPGDIPAAFGRELSGVFSIAAVQTELKLVPTEDVVSVELLHRLDVRPLDNGMLVELGEVASGAPRQALFRITRRDDPTSPRCGTVAVSYREPDGSVGDGHVLGVELPELPLSVHAQAVTLERMRLAVAAAVDQAWARRASSTAGEAVATLDEIRQALRKAKQEKRADASELDLLLGEIAEAEKAVARSAAEREKARRSMRERSHITLVGRSHVGKLPEPDPDS